MKMKIVAVCCLVLLQLGFGGCLGRDAASVTIRGESSIASTDDNYICATLDWWPQQKCDYHQCPWGNTSILNMNLTNKILINAIKAFGPMRIRVGGSLQDSVVYDVGNGSANCPEFKPDKNGLFGFSNGCLPRKKWDELNHLFNQTGVLVTFGLNALNGKKPSQQGISWVGPWNSRNARDFIKYNVENGYKIDSYELGNELCGTGISAQLDSIEYAHDITSLKNLVEELYSNASTKPKVLGPAGFYEKNWFDTFLRTVGPNVVDAVTHHIYNLGSGHDHSLLKRIRNPSYLDKISRTFENVLRSVEEAAPTAGVWVGEGGGAYNSGGTTVQDRFAGGFWYLDQLGMASSLNHKVYCRQALIGGNYGLLNTTNFIPNPDYYGALLWHRLMGKEVLSTSHNGSPHLRAYSHCSRNKPDVTLLLINLSNSTAFDVSIGDGLSLRRKTLQSRSQREEYHLTAKEGDIQSNVVLLNGTPLQLTNASDIPEMEPVVVDSSSDIRVAPDSFVFVVLKGISARACT